MVAHGFPRTLPAPVFWGVNFRKKHGAALIRSVSEFPTILDQAGEELN